MFYSAHTLRNIHYRSFEEPVVTTELSSQAVLHVKNLPTETDATICQKIELTQDQILKLTAILEEEHLVESKGDIKTFTINANAILKPLMKKLYLYWPHSLKYRFDAYLIGSRAGSLFKNKECGDSDFFIQCTVYLEQEKFDPKQLPTANFLSLTKQILDYMRNSIEHIILREFEKQSGESSLSKLTLKDVWNKFFTKKKCENAPIFTLKSQAGNRFGMVHIGQTFEIKYAVDYILGDNKICGLAHPCTFVQDDLRIDINSLIFESTSKEKPLAISIENPIEKVLQSLEKNELMIEKPEPSKFFPLLLKYTLKEGIALRDQLEDSFKLAIANIPIPELFLRLSNYLSEKTPLQSLIIIINLYILMSDCIKDDKMRELFEKQLSQHLRLYFNEDANAIASNFSQATLLSFFTFLFLSASKLNYQESCFLQDGSTLIQIIRPKSHLKLIYTLLGKHIDLDLLYLFYQKSSLRPSTILIENKQDLFKTILSYSRIELPFQELALLTQAIALRDLSLFKNLGLEQELQAFESYIPYLDTLLFLEPFEEREYTIDSLKSILKPFEISVKNTLLSLHSDSENLTDQLKNLLQQESINLFSTSTNLKQSLYDFYHALPYLHHPYLNLLGLKLLWVYHIFYPEDDKKLYYFFNYLFGNESLPVTLFSTQELFENNIELFNQFNIDMNLKPSWQDDYRACFSHKDTFCTFWITYFSTHDSLHLKKLACILFDKYQLLAIESNKQEVKSHAFHLLLHLYPHINLMEERVSKFKESDLLTSGTLSALLSFTIEMQKYIEFTTLINLYQNLVSLVITKEEQKLETPTFLPLIYHFIDTYLDKPLTKLSAIKIRQIFELLHRYFFSISSIYREQECTVKAKFHHHLSHSFQDLYVCFFIDLIHQNLIQEPLIIHSLNQTFSHFIIDCSKEEFLQFNKSISKHIKISYPFLQTQQKALEEKLQEIFTQETIEDILQLYLILKPSINLKNYIDYCKIRFQVFDFHTIVEFVKLQTHHKEQLLQKNPELYPLGYDLMDRLLTLCFDYSKDPITHITQMHQDAFDTFLHFFHSIDQKMPGKHSENLTLKVMNIWSEFNKDEITIPSEAIKYFLFHQKTSSFYHPHLITTCIQKAFEAKPQAMHRFAIKLLSKSHAHQLVNETFIQSTLPSVLNFLLKKLDNKEFKDTFERLIEANYFNKEQESDFFINIYSFFITQLRNHTFKEKTIECFENLSTIFLHQSWILQKWTNSAVNSNLQLHYHTLYYLTEIIDPKEQDYKIIFVLFEQYVNQLDKNQQINEIIFLELFNKIILYSKLHYNKIIGDYWLIFFKTIVNYHLMDRLNQNSRSANFIAAIICEVIAFENEIKWAEVEENCLNFIHEFYLLTKEFIIQNYLKNSRNWILNNYNYCLIFNFSKLIGLVEALQKEEPSFFQTFIQKLSNIEIANDSKQEALLSLHLNHLNGLELYLDKDRPIPLTFLRDTCFNLSKIIGTISTLPEKVMEYIQEIFLRMIYYVHLTDQEEILELILNWLKNLLPCQKNQFKILYGNLIKEMLQSVYIYQFANKFFTQAILENVLEVTQDKDIIQAIVEWTKHIKQFKSQNIIWMPSKNFLHKLESPPPLQEINRVYEQFVELSQLTKEYCNQNRDRWSKDQCLQNLTALIATTSNLQFHLGQVTPADHDFFLQTAIFSMNLNDFKKTLLKQKNGDIKLIYQQFFQHLVNYFTKCLILFKPICFRKTVHLRHQNELTNFDAILSSAQKGLHNWLKCNTLRI